MRAPLHAQAHGMPAGSMASERLPRLGPRGGLARPRPLHLASSSTTARLRQARESLQGWCSLSSGVAAVNYLQRARRGRTPIGTREGREAEEMPGKPSGNGLLQALGAKMYSYGYMVPVTSSPVLYARLRNPIEAPRTYHIQISKCVCPDPNSDRASPAQSPRGILPATYGAPLAARRRLRFDR